MAYHTVAYSSSTGVNASNTQINAINDAVFMTQNNQIFPPVNLSLIGAAAVGPSLTKARVYTPKILQVCHHSIRPINRATGMPSNPGLEILYNNPISLNSLEGIICDASNNLGAATENENIILFLGDSPTPVPQGSPLTVHATGTQTLTAFNWTQCALTYDDNLPSWQFAVVGVHGVSTGCVATRLTFPGQSYRPGMLGGTSIGNLEHLVFQGRQFGVLGTFRPPVFPTIEFFSVSADTTQDVFLSLIRVGT